MATTPCPICARDTRVPEGDEGACSACGAALRFIDAPEVPCGQCKKMVPHLPSQEAVQCRCGHWQAVSPARAVRFEADCPRCRRTLEVPAAATEHTCPACNTRFTFQDTF